jgi:hypothetical protein
MPHAIFNEKNTCNIVTKINVYTACLKKIKTAYHHKHLIPVLQNCDNSLKSGKKGARQNGSHN